MEHVDLAVVGAGFLGLSAAASFAAARPGARVVVLTDEAEIGENAASARTGGHILPGFARDAAALEVIYGTETARWLQSFAMDAVQYLLADSTVAFPMPTLIGTSDNGLVQDFRDEAAALERFGYPAPLLGPDERSAAGANEIAIGYREPAAGILRGEARLSELATRCRALGVEIRTAEIEHVVDDADGVTLALDDTALSAEAVVVGAGPATPELIGDPVELTAKTTTSFRFDAPEGIDRLAVCLSGDWIEYYWINDGELRFGIRAEPPPDWAAATERATLRLGRAPGEPRTIAQGQIWRRESGMPVVRARSRLIAAYGFNGHGVALTNRIGQLAGAAFAGDAAARAGLDRLADILAP